MNCESVVAATASQTTTNSGPKRTDTFCLLAPQVLFLAVLGWATWEISLVKPMAFEMFAGLIVFVLALSIVGVLPRQAGRFRSTPARNREQFGGSINWARSGNHADNYRHQAGAAQTD
jgi:hypothetical protein